MVDIKLAVFNTLFMATGAISALAVTPYVAATLLSKMVALSGPVTAELTWIKSAIGAVILFLVQDFCRFWNHYAHHEYRYLWPFHAVHHSAEVMTPITFMRAHILYNALQMLVLSALVGATTAVLLFVLVGQIAPWTLYASAWTFNAYMFFGGHLRHSHI